MALQVLTAGAHHPYITQLYVGDAMVFVHTIDVKHTSVGCILLYTHVQYYIVKYI